MKGKHVWAGNKFVREIIPECVVKLVRQLDPNQEGKTYENEAPMFKIQADIDKEKAEHEEKERRKHANDAQSKDKTTTGKEKTTAGKDQKVVNGDAKKMPKPVGGKDKLNPVKRK